MTTTHTERNAEAGLDVHALPATTAAGEGRRAALAELQRAADGVEPVGVVGYASGGNTLLVGPAAAPLLDAAARLGDSLPRVVVAPDAQPVRKGSLTVLTGRLASLRGVLGQYDARLAVPSAEKAEQAPSVAELADDRRDAFDLVFDFHETPWIAHDLPPFGYYPVGREPDRLESALADAPEMVGEFEKPKFFAYDPDLCAHGARSQTGCTRCLDTCPSGAISSLGDLIEVDPTLCQGVGVCVSTCPAGALTYAYPRPAELLESIRDALRAYRQAGAAEPVLLFHDTDAGFARLAEFAADLPENVIPVAVEEVPSVGLDVWAACIAYGVARVGLLGTARQAAGVVAEVQRQIGYADTIFGGLGHSGRVVWVDADNPDPVAFLTDGLESALERPASFWTFNEKRGTLRFALQHVQDQVGTPEEPVELPSGAPFGNVRVDQNACTLCLACATVCPTRAIADGGDEAPRIAFTEDLCVQCGLCEVTCPESAITLEPRFNYDWEARRAPRVLYEEQPFHCIRCGTAFGTQSGIERMMDRLQGHQMFSSEQDLERLKMCGDCRVKDLFTEEMGSIEERRKPKVFGLADDGSRSGS